MTAFARWIFCIALLLQGWTLRAQDTVISIGDSVEGELLPGESLHYSLTVRALTLLSFRVEALDDQLDPQLEVLDAAGDLVIENDDFAYPTTREAIVQAFVVPNTAEYMLVVSGFDASGGKFRLHVLPGYDRLTLRDTAMDPQNWQVVHSEAEVGLGASTVFAVDMTGLGRSALIQGARFPSQRDFYFELAFDYVSAVNNWQVGLIFHYQAPDRYHRLLLSKTGYWRMEHFAGGNVKLLQDWATHPVIVPGQAAFRLGVLVAGQHIDVVYDGQVIGTAWDAGEVEPGGVGIALKTDETYGGLMSFAVLGAQMTVPTRLVDGATAPRRLLTRRAYLMAQSLARQQLAPGDGEIKLTLPESAARHSRPGVTRVPIASDWAFAQFALGAEVDIERRTDGNGGCGIVFHYGNDEYYSLAYVTGAGDYGVARRDGAGFEPGIYGRRTAPDDATRQLLLIVSDEGITYYVDEVYAGSLPSQPRIGGLGIAVVNYESVDTTCYFADLWLYEFGD